MSSSTTALLLSWLADNHLTAIEVRSSSTLQTQMLSHIWDISPRLGKRRILLSLELLSNQEFERECRELTAIVNHLHTHAPAAAISRNGAATDLAIRHFYWQIKRKMAGLPVEHPRALVLVNQDDDLTSAAIGHILSAIPRWAIEEVGFTDMRRGNRVTGRVSKYVLYHRELSPVVTDAMKELITESALPTSARNIVTTIAGSLKSARGWWYTSIVADQINLDVLARYDWRTLFRSIDHLAPSPMFDRFPYNIGQASQ